MGCMNSKPSYIDSEYVAGGEREYQKRFLETKTLGEGEFGVVKLIHDQNEKADDMMAKHLAVKYLRKGFIFKDNTLFSPLKKEMLQGEVEILRRLNGECYNLKLVSVYESPSTIYMITEYCEGGEMIPYLSKAFQETGGLRTEDVSRISYQLWSAVNHCAKHNVMHRDIKPENIMFSNLKKDSELRLIDFGSGTCDGPPAVKSGDAEIDIVSRHHTFAGSAFYISPEMFQRNYTPKTDVWSAGATLYVLVAGYPAERLQEAFNVLHSTTEDRSKQLPNLPDNLPDTYYDMLEAALSYKHKARSTAGQLMSGEFAQFHFQHGQVMNDVSSHGSASEADASGGTSEHDVQEQLVTPARTKSVLLEGSVNRHNAYLGYQKFERSVTTVLATMLTKEQAGQLLTLLEEESKKESTKNGNAFGVEKPLNDAASIKTNKEKLQVVTIATLLDVTAALPGDEDDIADVLNMIRSQKGFTWYESFAYHISSLRQFVSTQTTAKVPSHKAKVRDSLAVSMRAKLLDNSTTRTAVLNMSAR